MDRRDYRQGDCYKVARDRLERAFESLPESAARKFVQAVAVGLNFDEDFLDEVDPSDQLERLLNCVTVFELRYLVDQFGEFCEIEEAVAHRCPVPPVSKAPTTYSKQGQRVTRRGTPVYRNFTIPPCREYKGLGRSGDVLACSLFSDDAGSEFPKSVAAARQHRVLGKWFVFVYPNALHVAKVKDVGYRYLYGVMWHRPNKRVGNFRLRRDGMIAAYRVMEVRPGRDNEWRKDRDFVAAINRISSESNGQRSTANEDRVV